MTTTIDIALCIDCSSSITSYFNHIRANILLCIDKILFKHQQNVRLALIKFRSHTDYWKTDTFPFTSSVDEFREWINEIHIGGVNSIECKAIDDALDECLTLDWRSTTNLYKSHENLVILITDGPPCNLLHDVCDHNVKDLWKIADKFDQQDIKLAVVGIESSVIICDDFYCALAHKTGGEYIPLINAVHALTSVIQRVLLEEETLTQSFRYLDIHMDIEFGSLFCYSQVYNRAHCMIQYCKTMMDIRKEFYTYRYEKKHKTVDNNDEDVHDMRKHDDQNNFEIQPSSSYHEHFDRILSENINIISSTPTTDDEGYRTRLPTTASGASSFIHIIDFSTFSYRTDIDSNSEIDDECF